MIERATAACESGGIAKGDRCHKRILEVCAAIPAIMVIGSGASSQNSLGPPKPLSFAGASANSRFPIPEI